MSLTEQPVKQLNHEFRFLSREGLQELEKAVKTLACQIVFPQYSRSPELPLVFS